MKTIIPIALIAVGLAACGSDGRRSAKHQDYETVQEGSASGVTAAIRGPGETLPPITGTNADTTTAFGIDPSRVPAAPQPGTVAETFPPPARSVDPSSPQVPPPMTSATPAPEPAPRPRPIAPRPQPEPQPVPTEPEQTDTTATEPPPPPPTQTDTIAPPPPVDAEKPKKKEPRKEKPPKKHDDDTPPSDTSEAEEPPPPPPA
ncbi:MAG TPA: hypothetical protein VFO89_08430 [Thermoanaerobaculia bacterium]|nr:hypothetical protein [Thermoanaerobaculia bacterium]